MKHKDLSRREFLEITTKAVVGAAIAPMALSVVGCSPTDPAGIEKPIVSIARIQNDNIGAAVEEAIDLLGGIDTVAKDKERIMLKPNLVAESPTYTTKREVIQTLAQLMIDAGKDVSIGEGSAAAAGFNVTGGVTYRTSRQDILDAMQQYVFEQLGYTELATALGVPLINLHSGDMVNVPVPDGLAFEEITLHHALDEIDLLCSVPMMKTHVLATVTLGMKNLIGAYPGTAYCSVRACVHDQAAQAGSPGIAYEIIDMVRANKLGLTVVDGYMAMEGDGPTGGTLAKMDVIIAGTNPLATDMVAAEVMGIGPSIVPTFTAAHAAGMTPEKIDDIEIRGAAISTVQRILVRPNVVTWESISDSWGVQELT
ncbi:MAG: DUF362 domain-containing protein [Fidelibacterota bacterium]|nr:MAG: DUF362 domain-containing protein [Candidatus Neomarinimicrobiota bacterium]